MSLLSLLNEHSQASFFSNGPDPFVGMDMAEAATASVYMMQNVITEGVDMSRRNDEMCLRAIMTESASPQYLIEASAGSLMDKIKSVFGKIKQFFIGVYNKIRMFFDKIFMSSKNLVSKYKNSDVIKNNTFDDIEYTGYKYIDNIGTIWNDKAAKVAEDCGEANAIKVIFNDAKYILTDNEILKVSKTDKEGEKPNYKKVQDAIEAIKDLDEADRKLAVLNHITDLTLDNADTAYADIMEYLQGGDSSKINITGVDKNKVMEYLSKPEKEDKVIKLYQDYIKSVDKALNTFKKNAEKAAKENKDGQSGNTKDFTGADLLISYTDTLVSATSSAFKNANLVGSAKVAAIQGKAKQYRMLFGKMISYKKKKAGEAFDIIDTFDDFDTEILDYLD